MKTLKIMNLSYGKNQCRYTILKERDKNSNKRTFIVAELPFYEDDNELNLRETILASSKYKSYLDALEDYSARLEQEWKLG